MAQKNEKLKKAKTQTLLDDATLAAAGQGDPAVNAPVTKTGARDVGRLGKANLAEHVAKNTSLSKGQANLAVDAMIGAVVEALRQGQSVGLPGLGTLSVRETAARSGVRPGTSERIQIPAGRKVAFKAATTLRGSLGGGSGEGA
ncbi:histone-like protein DNA-binding protein [Deinococcus aerius]|uniref:Histone-like protein DNA-binding protein n=1 Tax=Deinococcus aerius TaxID=200253 RepID=A0A2I9DIM8_9DEIO|nr:HU family DNA-binding protein [Deinococcus aerius]GBF06128.1 histone-like protein DNA-binding protein [Deinococcus aerius]